MKPVYQTKLGPPDGDCVAACIASILELGLAEVPNYHGEDWFDQYCRWLEPYGLSLVLLPHPDKVSYPDCYGFGDPYGYYLACGQSPRGDDLHSVVCKDGELVHDPHPEGGGILKPYSDWIVFQVRDPKRLLSFAHNSFDTPLKTC